MSQILLSSVKQNPFQYRNKFDQQKLKDLADNIKENGLLQAIKVRPKNGIYEIVFGENRIRAIRDILKWKTISSDKIIIENVSDEDMWVQAFSENEFRDNTLVYDKIISIKNQVSLIIKTKKCSADSAIKLITKKMGIKSESSRRYLHDLYKAGGLSKDILNKIKSQETTVNQLQELLRLKIKEKDRNTIIKKATDEKWTTQASRNFSKIYRTSNNDQREKLKTIKGIDYESVDKFESVEKIINNAIVPVSGEKEKIVVNLEQQFNCFMQSATVLNSSQSYLRLLFKHMTDIEKIKMITKLKTVYDSIFETVTTFRDFQSSEKGGNKKLLAVFEKTLE